MPLPRKMYSVSLWKTVSAIAQKPASEITPDFLDSIAEQITGGFNTQYEEEPDYPTRVSVLFIMFRLTSQDAALDIVHHSAILRLERIYLAQPADKRLSILSNAQLEHTLFEQGQLVLRLIKKITDLERKLDEHTVSCDEVVNGLLDSTEVHQQPPLKHKQKGAAASAAAQADDSESGFRRFKHMP